MVAASVIKLDLLEALLYSSQQSGQPLSATDDSNAEAMIKNSDNAAGDRVWNAAGRNEGVQSYNSVLGMTNTVLDPSGVWGLSTTSAPDQLLLLRALTSATSPLTAASRGYALSLMTDVEADQRWGVAAAADPDSTTANKNGWLDIDSDGGLWVVSSVGVVKVGGHTVLMVVLSQHEPDFQTGVTRVQRAATQVAASL